MWLNFYVLSVYVSMANCSFYVSVEPTFLPELVSYCLCVGSALRNALLENFLFGYKSRTRASERVRGYCGFLFRPLWMQMSTYICFTSVTTLNWKHSFNDVMHWCLLTLVSPYFIPLYSPNSCFLPLCSDCLSVPRCKMRFPYLITATNHTLGIYRGMRSRFRTLPRTHPAVADAVKEHPRAQKTAWLLELHCLLPTTLPQDVYVPQAPFIGPKYVWYHHLQVFLELF